jgi:hypothetical protein
MTEPIKKPDQIHAPWTQTQVDALNDWQQLGFVHEFTCACGGHTVLVATLEGWTCPKGCGYRQEWAWAFMADRSDPIWTNPLDRLFKERAAGARTD